MTELNSPIVMGGELIHPGDIVFGDTDGVVAVRREEAGWNPFSKLKFTDCLMKRYSQTAAGLPIWAKNDAVCSLPYHEVIHPVKQIATARLA